MKKLLENINTKIILVVIKVIDPSLHHALIMEMLDDYARSYPEKVYPEFPAWVNIERDA